MKTLKPWLILSGIGLVLGLAAWPVLLRWTQEVSSPDVIVLRVAHMSLDPPVHRAFDILAAEFQKTHPQVRIKQMPVPQRLYRTWLSTQLIGGTPPDIVEVPPWSAAEDVLPYFVELGDELHQPNPANSGTELAAVPWHETFVNGLRDQPNFYEAVLGYYSVPMSVITLRLVYNRELLEKTYGFKHPPRTMAELHEQCAAIEGRNHATGERVVPLVVSGWKATSLLQSIARSHTAGLAAEIDVLHAGWNWDDERSVAYLRNRWSLESREIRESLEQMRQLGRHFPPGFQAVTDGDAVFPFMQGQAVFYIALSGEYTTLLSQCEFPLGVTLIPRADAKGASEIAEGNLISMASLGITRQSPHRELALEFLRFATSRPGNAMFSAESQWLPGVRGLPTEEKLAGFAASTSGNPPGFSPWLLSDPDLNLFINQNLHHLLGRDGSVEAFEDVLQPAYPSLVAGGMRRFIRKSNLLLQRLDLALAARDRMHAGADDNAVQRAEADHLFEVEVITTLRIAYMQQALREAEASAESKPGQ